MSANSNKYQGYIKLYRSLADWEWFDDPLVLKVYIWCLLQANIEDKKWHGIEIKRGQFVSSYQKIAEGCNISVWQARRCISALISSSNLTSKKYAKYTVFIVQNYDDYQKNHKQTHKQTPIETTTTKEYKKKRNNIPTNSPSKRGSVGLYENLEDYPEL